MVQTNFDYLCAKYGQEILEYERDKNSKNDETVIQKSLGVLQEDGLFAFILFLKALKDKSELIRSSILKKTAELLNETKLTENADEKNIQEKILEITENMDDMFLAKDLIEKTLVYARYRAKAIK